MEGARSKTPGEGLCLPQNLVPGGAKTTGEGRCWTSILGCQVSPGTARLPLLCVWISYHDLELFFFCFLLNKSICFRLHQVLAAARGVLVVTCGLCSGAVESPRDRPGVNLGVTPQHVGSYQYLSNQESNLLPRIERWILNHCTTREAPA